MSFEIQQSTDFNINELVIITKSGKIDVRNIFEEMSIFDSVFMPVMSGQILITDSIGLSNKLLFDGSESLLIDIVKDEGSQIANFKKAFRIYKQSGRKEKNLNAEQYILYFVSDELMYSDQQRINQGYEKTYTEIAKNIMTDYLKIPKNNLKGMYEDSLGIRKVIIPNLRPLEALEWCAKRAVDIKNAPSFLFYQNITGYNFATLSTLLTTPVILNLRFEPKNTSDKDPIDEISSARSFEVMSQVDAINKTRSGVNSGQFIGFDPLTRSVSTKTIGYKDHYDLIDHGNKNPNFSKIENRDHAYNDEMYGAKKTVSTFSAFRKESSYIKQKDPTSISKEENFENILFQRKAIIQNLTEKRIKFTMPGNFTLSSGFNVQATIPSISKKEKGDSNEDATLTGKYLIIASRHIIKMDKHETIIEVASSSSDNDFIPVGAPEQTSEIMDY